MEGFAEGKNKGTFDSFGVGFGRGRRRETTDTPKKKPRGNPEVMFLKVLTMEKFLDGTKI